MCPTKYRTSDIALPGPISIPSAIFHKGTVRKSDEGQAQPAGSIRVDRYHVFIKLQATGSILMTELKQAVSELR